MSARPAPARSGGVAPCAAPAAHSRATHASGSARRSMRGSLSGGVRPGARYQLELERRPIGVAERRTHVVLAVEAALEAAALRSHMNAQPRERPRLDGDPE